MKRFVISFILVFGLTSHAYGMGRLGGGHQDGDRGAVVKTGGDSKIGTSGTTGNDGGRPGINNGSDDHGVISTTSTSYSQQNQSGSNTHAVPEPLTLLLLGSGLIGLVGFWKKFKK